MLSDFAVFTKSINRQCFRFFIKTLVNWQKTQKNRKKKASKKGVFSLFFWFFRFFLDFFAKNVPFDFGNHRFLALFCTGFWLRNRKVLKKCVNFAFFQKWDFLCFLKKYVRRIQKKSMKKQVKNKHVKKAQKH